MITKCDFPGCDKAGTCRAPKDRTLNSYYHFCREHAAEYNKNWNYYANMTPEEVEEDWERITFGESEKDKKRNKSNSTDYVKFLEDFINGRSKLDAIYKKRQIPSPVLRAFKTLELPITATHHDVQIQYRKMAKKYHPDTTNYSDKSVAAGTFSAIADAYSELEKYFSKK